MNANKQDAGGLPELPDGYMAGEFVANTIVYDAGQMRAYGEQCRAASGLSDHEACALVDSLIDAVWDEANSAHKGTTGECVNAAKETERVKHELLRALSRGVPEGMVLVPNVMTRAMLDAMRRSMGDHSETFEDWWECEGQYAVRHYYAAIAAQRKEG